MRYKLLLGEEGASTFPLIVLFGVILAFLMAFLFISLYNQQLNAQVDEQANALANNLALTAFTSLSGGQPILELPRDVGGSPYAIAVQEEGIFVVRITGGRMVGNTYSAIVNASLKADNQDFSPVGRVYFQENTENRGQIIVSPVPIENMPAEISGENISSTPPSFYLDFARYGDNQPEAAAIGAAYFDALVHNPEKHNIDISGYTWEQENSLLRVQVTSIEENFIMQIIISRENYIDVGGVENAWIIENIENILGNIDNPTPCPSPDNAYRSGWLYSKQDALDHLRSRTWQSGGTMVVVPADASIQAAAATTNVSTYPTWRVTFESDGTDYVIFYRMMPWWENDSEPGFIFQSGPELQPVV